MHIIEIPTKNGSIKATIFSANAQPSAVLIIATATGVKQSFYKKFAAFVSNNKVIVITFDYLGIGLSLQQPIQQLTINASDWGRIDLEAVIQYAFTNYPDVPINVLGHSIGGQLIGLAKSSTKVNKLILVAAQSGYWRFWEGAAKIRMCANWYLLFPLFIRLFGYMPSKKISSMENLPKLVAKQWSSWGRKPNYLFDDASNNELFFDTISIDVFAISIDDDVFAPKQSVDWFTAKYSNANIKTLHIQPKDYGTKHIGHFGIFKEKFAESIWPILVNEIQKTVD
jgi:predicted alpha/beta hydrolase